jgi:hypothetical protein
MRILAIVTAVLGATAALAQVPEAPNPAPRFNVLFNERFFKQAAPRETLASLVKAGELGQYDYIASYLMDEAAANAIILAHAKDAERQAEKDLMAIRQRERADPYKPRAENALPLDPAAFAKRVEEEATWRGYRQLVNEIGERFREDPAHLRDLQRYLRDGETTIAENAAKIEIRKEPGKALYFRKVGNRWFIEDRTRELPAPPMANP